MTIATLSDYYICTPLSFQAKEHELTSELCLVNASLAVLQSQVNAFLHQKELDYFSTLTFERRQLSYLLGRFAAKQALAHYKTGTSLIDILIEYGAFQYPLVQLPDKDKLQVSYSHSNESAIALAFPEKLPLGIDLEIIDPEKNEAIESQLTTDDKRLLSELNDSDSTRTLTLTWTIKEALSKVLRTGLMTPFEIFCLQSIQFENNKWVSQFKNFAQYQAISFQLGKFICSIVCPKRSQIQIDIIKLQQWFANKDNT